MGSRIPRPRRIYTNRTLNLRNVKAVGFDMDYTLIHYDMEEWERLAYGYALRSLADEGWEVEGLEFDPSMATRGLVLDIELGNLLKANRFGFIKQACHGTTPLEYDEIRQTYARSMVDLAEPRWVFLNTLFSISEANLYLQLVDKADARGLPEDISDFGALYRKVRATLDAAHLEGSLKRDILADPERYVTLDEECVLTLRDFRAAGKKVLLITNSEWTYTRGIMTYAFDRFLPAGQTWRDLFDVVIVDARKPSFFTQRNPLYEVATEEGLLRPVPPRVEPGKYYSGGDARVVEEWLGVNGEEVLYVGDHIFSDVHVSKNLQRWRTALVLRELEEEVVAIEEHDASRSRLRELMTAKEALEEEESQLRVQRLRLEQGYGPEPDLDRAELERRLSEVRSEMEAVDVDIRPLAEEAARQSHPRWGPLLRTGNDKSHLARQVERYADVYTSRVANFGRHGPYAYLRSARGSLPHDPNTGGPNEATSA